MANNQIEGQKILDTTRDGALVLTTIMHGGTTADSTFQVDQSCNEILSVRSRNGGTNPTATLGTASTGLKTITVSGGRSGKCDVITRHQGGLAGFNQGRGGSESG